MNKRILITSTELMMIQFLVPHVIHLSENGYKVDIACSDVGGRMDEIRENLKGYAEKIHEVRLERSPVSPKNLLGYQDMKKVINQEEYDIIWTNEPVMGVVTRLAARKARKKGTKVLYMVHGFHFYKGAPKKYWLMFYPIEKIASRLCDGIITINKEDYERAKTFHAKEVRYIHGIGVDTSRLKPDDEVQSDIKKEIGITEDAFLILSVGELLPRKNQQVIIRALGLLKDKDIHYILCGKGKQLAGLQKLAKENQVENQVHFLGYRKDVLNIYGQTDLLAFPSMREGLGLAGLEAMYCGLPLVTSNTSGPRDYMENGKTGYMFDPYDANGFAKGIQKLHKNVELRKTCGEYNQKAVIPYYIENVKKEVLELIEEF